MMTLVPGHDQAPRVALVTGAGSGIGRAIALALGRDGWRVACADRDREGADETVRQLASIGFAVTADVTLPEDCKSMVEESVRHFGHLAGFVAAAGIQVTTRAPADELPPDEWTRVLQTNLTGTFLSTVEAGRAMRKKGVGGAMVLVGSIAARSAPVPGIAPYVASKAGLEGLSRALAVDWAPSDIRVNAISPGIVLTPMTEVSLGDASTRAGHEARIPVARIAEPDDIAGAAVFLLSNAARYITGTSLVVDGGWSIA